MLPKRCQTPFWDFRNPVFMRVSSVFACSSKMLFSSKGQIVLSSLEWLIYSNSHTHTNKMQAVKHRLTACKRLKKGWFRVFSCRLGLLSEKVLLSELSKVVRKIHFALFRKMEKSQNSSILVLHDRFLVFTIYSAVGTTAPSVSWLTRRERSFSLRACFSPSL